MDHIVDGLQGCVIYIDGAVIYSDTWEEHLVNIHAFLECLAAAKMTVNLTNSDFAHVYATYFGQVAGQGQVCTRVAKVKCILEKYPVPTTRKELMRFLDMARYYKKFFQNIADIVSPLTNLLSK